MESINTHTVEVEVILMQHNFVLRCTQSEELRLRQVAALLDSSMQTIQARGKSLSFERMLLLSSMHMGAELLKAQDVLQQLEQDLHTLNRNIDSSIMSSSSL